MGNVIAERVKSARLTKAQQKIAEYFILFPIRHGVPLMWLMLSHRQQERIR